MTSRMRRTKPAPVGPKRPGISKKPPRTPKLNPDVMEKAFSDKPLKPEDVAWSRMLGATAVAPYYAMPAFRESYQVIRFVPLKPTLRDRWVRFVNGIGGRLLRYGR